MRRYKRLCNAKKSGADWYVVPYTIWTISFENIIIRKAEGIMSREVYLFANLKKILIVERVLELIFEKAGRSAVVIGSDTTVIRLTKFIAAL